MRLAPLSIGLTMFAFAMLVMSSSAALAMGHVGLGSHLRVILRAIATQRAAHITTQEQSMAASDPAVMSLAAGRTESVLARAANADRPLG